MATQKTKVRRLAVYRRPLAIAASVLILVVCGLSWWQFGGFSGPLSDEALFAQYHVSYQASDTVRGENDQEGLYQEALKQYQQKNYVEAAAALVTYLEVKPDDMSASFVLGQAYLNQDPPQLANAAVQLQRVIDDGRHILVSKAGWYLALVYLKQGNRAQAKQQLQMLFDADDSRVADQAKALYEEL